MIQNNNLSPLPWYTTIEQQNHRKSYAYGDVFPLISQPDRFLPFQFVRPTNANTNFIMSLQSLEPGRYFQLVHTQMKTAGMKIIRFPQYGYDVVYYPALYNVLNLGEIPQGRYMYHYVDYNPDGTVANDCWSEVFTVVKTPMAGYMTLEWWDDQNLYFENGVLVYDGAYKNRQYICADIGKPDYLFEEDGENRDGFFFPEKQLSEKQYTFTFIAPEYMCDAMRLIRLSDHKRVICNGITYNCDTFLMTVKWQTQGNYAAVTVEFETDTVVKKIGSGYIPTQGNFNNDFNDDFNDDFNN